MAENTEPELDGNDVCVCLHTALRKYCDSKITSAAYNLIQMICNMKKLKPKANAWTMLGDRIAEMINEGKAPLSATKIAIRQLDKMFSERVTRPRHRKGKRPPGDSLTVLHALQCTLLCFEDDDLEGFVALLEKDD